MTISLANPLQFCWRMIPWFIIKQTWIEMKTIGDPCRECFHCQNSKHEQPSGDKKEIDLVLGDSESFTIMIVSLKIS